jgi:hypothetical protein
MLLQAGLYRFNRAAGHEDNNQFQSTPRILTMSESEQTIAKMHSVLDTQRKLIREMQAANIGWGAPRIHGDLLKLGKSSPGHLPTCRG